MAKVFHRIETWIKERESIASEGLDMGFVPTMGALHKGHIELLRRARAENQRVAMSIFVNPTQFDDPADLKQYPRTLEADLEMAGDLVDYVISPAPEDMYRDGYTYKVSESQLSTRLEGAHRPGHFDGVLTVVLKLLNLAGAKRAYFGEKDWQQLRLVQGMAEAFFIPTQIIACPTVRDDDGLALSSRNRRLSPDGRSRAAVFPRILAEAPTPEDARARLEAEGLHVDYVETVEGVRLGAVRIENVRLIDNVRL